MQLGRGVNLAPFSVRYERLDPAADLAGLKARGVQHVRIGGWIAASLQNWTTCPATMIKPVDEQAAVSHILAGEAAAPDPAASRAFWRLWLAAKAAVDAGLLVVLNPFHQRMLVPVSNETVRWVWAAMLQEFSVVDFPVDRVAFEMVNEPANWTHAKVVGDAWGSIVHEWVVQVRRAQPDRVLILTGVQGWRGGRQSPTTSREGLIMDLHGGDLVSPACDDKCMVTFHYYEPRWFTTRARRRNTSAPELGWFDTEANLAQMAEHFESVVNATPPGVGIYLGEFGLATDKVDMAQGSRWLAAVRRTAVSSRLAGYTVWTYYGTENGLVPEIDGSSANDRLCVWDRSRFASSALGLPAPHDETECSGHVAPSASQNVSLNISASSSSPRVCPADGERRPPWADALVVLPRSHKPSGLVSAALYIDVIAGIVLFAGAVYWLHLRCSGQGGGSGRNRMMAVRQTVQYNTNVPPPTISPPQPTPSPGQPQEVVVRSDAAEMRSALERQERSCAPKHQPMFSWGWRSRCQGLLSGRDAPSGATAPSETVDSDL